MLYLHSSYFSAIPDNSTHPHRDKSTYLYTLRPYYPIAPHFTSLLSLVSSPFHFLSCSTIFYLYLSLSRQLLFPQYRLFIDNMHKGIVFNIYYANNRLGIEFVNLL
jgi:hypothetical protein